MIPNVSVARAWCHIAPHVAWNNTASSGLNRVNYLLFFSTTKAQPSLFVNTLNSQVHFQWLLSWIFYQKPAKRKLFCICKLRWTSQKLICIEFHATITIKACRAPGGGLIKYRTLCKLEYNITEYNSDLCIIIRYNSANFLFQILSNIDKNFSGK